jgi:hypothetical protein
VDVAGRLVLVGGVVWLAVVVVFAAMMYRSARPPGGVQQNPTGSALVRTLNKAQPVNEENRAPWLVTHAAAAHHVMVVEVEARRVNEAALIASQIVEPVRDRGYEEILIYVRATGANPAAAARRVQWTPRGGYTELVFSDYR